MRGRSVPGQLLTIGEVAERAAISSSAIRYYESEGLISSERTAGNQRRFSRPVLRRIAVVKAAQAVGIPLSAIRRALDRLPDGRTPTRADWERLSESWRATLDDRISRLTRLRDELTGCIGCGCLSIDRCQLFNPGDELASRFTGGSRLQDPDRAGSPDQPGSEQG